MEQKDNSHELHILNHLGKGDQFVFYVFKKSSRISYAIYVITDLIKDSEPLKWSLRKVANELASVKSFFDERSVLNSVERSLMELESFLELALFARLLSFMNVNLLKSEITKLVSEIRERGDNSLYSGSLVSSFFEVSRTESIGTGDSLSASKQPRPEDDDKGHKGQINNNVFYKKSPIENKSQDQQKNLPKKLPTSSGGEQGNFGIDKSKRQSRIIDIIKSNNAEFVSIKDITSRLKDCSEKTVQRELLSMVESGVLKKSGERRWSTYALRG